ncbi:kinase-like domain-containing protein [Gymnopilus junonius]|uniref:non-specific serine/threonine protein kinase n=1 Tax=Gymnopilus junonius TaxID=109634 RepID=A0A9P5NNU9_GYMJU|nr:kinase-like domain-containing protein [Gymnopilus junonius]
MSSKNAPAVISPVHPPVGTLIDGGSLELVEVLGVGGYGVVYRAVDTRSPAGLKSYAVKCLVASGQQTARQRQIHIREIALHQLASAHPGVVTLHRVVEQGNHTYIIMDYAPDHDLFTQILHSCRYLGDDAVIKDVFLQLLDAVEYCHSLGIYHRDLKPENILCFDDGLRVAITDFGLATTDKLSDEFRTGSVYHMSPECQGGEFAPTGHYSPMFNDIWSLGIILLNLATGRNPWKSATPNDPTFQAYLRDPMGFLPSVLPISPEINEILVRMLEVDWRERSTLREVRYAIEEATTFYSDGAVFEGSMARCPWESGMDIDSASSGTNPDDNGPLSPPPQSSIPEADLNSGHTGARTPHPILYLPHSRWTNNRLMVRLGPIIRHAVLLGLSNPPFPPTPIVKSTME